MADMDAEFAKAKQQIEAEQGSPLEPAEEVVVKGLFCFGHGVKLKNQLEQEQREQQARRGVIQALRDYFSGPQSKSKRTPKQGSYSNQRQKNERKSEHNRKDFANAERDGTEFGNMRTHPLWPDQIR
jgi:hypothetical protein